MLAALIVFIAPGSSEACTCTVSGIELFESADAIVVGRVGQIERVDSPHEGLFPLRALRVGLQPFWVLKGEVEGGALDLWTEDSSCAAQFRAGTSYLALAIRDQQGRLWSDRCTGNAPLGPLLAVLVVLLSLMTFVGVCMIWAVRRLRRRGHE